MPSFAGRASKRMLENTNPGALAGATGAVETKNFQQFLSTSTLSATQRRAALLLSRRYALRLAAYYDTRRWSETGPAVAQALDLAAFQAGIRADGAAAELDVAIDGIRCASCVWLNEKLLLRTPGVLAARVNYATHRARVRFDPGVVELVRILDRIQSAVDLE